MEDEDVVVEQAEVATVEPGQVSVPTVEPETTELETENLPEEKEPTKEKTFTQAELEAELGKRLARQQRKFEREQLAQAELPPLKLTTTLKADDFATTEDYVDALATERAEAIITHKEAHTRILTADDAYHDRVEAVLEKYPDFKEVAYNNAVRITGEMAEVIRGSESGPEIAYHLGKNPEEALRISKLTPLAQAVELGKLELTVKTKKPEKQISKTPDPIKPVHGAAPSTPSYDTTDPRSTKGVSASDWIMRDRQRRAKLLQAKGYK